MEGENKENNIIIMKKRRKKILLANLKKIGPAIFFIILQEVEIMNLNGNIYTFFTMGPVFY